MPLWAGEQLAQPHWSPTRFLRLSFIFLYLQLGQQPLRQPSLVRAPTLHAPMPRACSGQHSSLLGSALSSSPPQLCPALGPRL